MEQLTSEQAWKVYNFINDYKAGQFGVISLQEAIDKYFKNYNYKK